MTGTTVFWKKFSPNMKNSGQLPLKKLHKPSKAHVLRKIICALRYRRMIERPPNSAVRFSEYESLQEDLQELEKLSRDYQKEMVAVEIKSDADLLQIKVLERAFLPESPSHPNYVRDAAFGIAGSLLLAIVSVLIFDFLTRPPARQDHQDAFGVTYNQVFQSLPSTLSAQIKDNSANQNLLPPVEQFLPHELTDKELKQMFIESGDITRRLIAGLLNGLSPEEIIRLKWADIDFDSGELKTLGNSARTIPLTPLHRSILLKNLPASMVKDNCILQDEKGVSFSLETVKTSLFEVAEQAQIQDPQQITPEALRHTYISFLARQGVRIREIEQITGPIPAHYHTIYRIMAPPGAEFSIETAQLSLPALQEFV